VLEAGRGEDRPAEIERSFLLRQGVTQFWVAKRLITSMKF